MTDYFMMKAREAALVIADERDARDWHDMDALTACAHTLEALDTERAAHEATKAELQAMREAVAEFLRGCDGGMVSVSMDRALRQALTRKDA